MPRGRKKILKPVCPTTLTQKLEDLERVYQAAKDDVVAREP